MVWEKRIAFGISLEELVTRGKLLLARMDLQNQVSRERAELAEMDEALLRDIGITRQDAQIEAMRSDSDLPQARLADLECRIALDHGKMKKTTR